MDLSQSFSAQTAPWQVKVNGSAYSSLLLPYSDGVAYASSAGNIFAEAGQGGTNQLAAGLVSYNPANQNVGAGTWLLYQMAHKSVVDFKYICSYRIR